MTEIQAALAHGNHAPLSFDTVEISDPAPGETLVRLVASGLCQTDLTVLDHAPLPWPAILGHEGAGIVEKVGAGVTKVSPGDHVVLTTASCGRCKSCLGGQPSLCVNFRAVNMTGGRRRDGSCTHSYHGGNVFAGFLGQSSFATYALVGERSIIPVPADLPLAVLAPLGCGIQTGAGAVLNTLNVRAGGSFVVFGAGAVGLSALMAARIAGCSPLIVVDKVESRLELARELGATHTLNAATDDVVARVGEITGGGATYSVEATGVAAVMAQAVQVLGHGGSAVLVGVAGAAAIVPISPTLLQEKGLTIKGTLMTGSHATAELFIPRLIAFWQAGEFPFDRLIKQYPFSEINDAIRDMKNGSVIKPLLLMPEHAGAVG